MVTATALSPSTSTGPEQHQPVEEKIKKLRELFADAPELGKKALENALHELKSQASELPPPVESAGRVGARLGKISELTIIVPLAPGGVLLDVLVSISVSSNDQKLLSPACCKTQSLFSPSMGRSQYSPISNPLGFCSDLFSTARRT